MSSDELKWLANVPVLFEQFQNIPYFDTSLQSNSQNIYHIVGGKSI